MAETDRGQRTASRPDYGIDAPGIIRNLLLAGAGALLLAALAARFLAGAAAATAMAAASVAASACLIEAALMLLYAKRGKFRHRDRMLALRRWRGDEQVLDIGTGRGLLLIGAAKRLTGGRAVGVDIWNPGDLSGNAPERTRRNLVLEGVADRCTLVDQPAQALGLPDASIDVVLSNLCLHNIPSHAERDQACRHIARVLKPGGQALISDFRFTADYADCLRRAGLAVSRSGPYLLDTFPPLRIVCAAKPAARSSGGCNTGCAPAQSG